jgi:hypothetical protein
MVRQAELESFMMPKGDAAILGMDDVEEAGDDAVDVEGGDVFFDEGFGGAIEGEDDGGEGVGFEASVNHLGSPAG